MIIHSIHVGRIWKIKTAVLYPIKRFIMTVLMWNILIQENKECPPGKIVDIILGKENKSYFVYPREDRFYVSENFDYRKFHCKGVFFGEAQNREDIIELLGSDDFEEYYESEYDMTKALFHEYAGYLNPGDLLKLSKHKILYKVRNKQHFDLIECYYLNQDSLMNCVKDTLLYRKYLKWSAKLFMDKLRRFL